MSGLIFRQNTAPYGGKNAPLTFVEGDDNWRWLESSSIASMSFDPITSTLMVYRTTSSGLYGNTNWAPISASLTGLTATASVIIASTAPPNTLPTGALWYDDVSGSLFILYDNSGSNIWVQANNGWSASYSTTSSIADFAFTSSIAYTASFITSSGIFGPLGSDSVSASIFAVTASYVDITGSGVEVNYFGSQIQLTASAAGTLQSVTTAGNQTSASIGVTGSLGVIGTSSFEGLAVVSGTLVLADYAINDYGSNAVAAAFGVPLGGIYRSGDFLMIRN